VFEPFQRLDPSRGAVLTPSRQAVTPRGLSLNDGAEKFESREQKRL
jgi:hypothetical protein